MDYIVLAIPVFFLLIGIELIIEKLKHTKHYRFNDAITNMSCGIGSQVINVFLKIAVLAAYVWAYENYRLFTLPPETESYSTAIYIGTWIVLFLGVDFFYYWFHRLAHEISFLWGSHIVHHQSEEYNLTVALRQGWLQGAFSWIFYMPLAFMGFDPIMFVTVNAFQTLYQFWIHTRHIDKMPVWYEFVFATPSHHRVHHGVNPKYIDRNHAGTLIIWDRMFGTFQAEEDEVVYGITTHANSWNPLRLNFEYWIMLFRDSFKAKGFTNKIKYLISEPGWKPKALGGPEVLKEVTTDTFEKYDTKIPLGLNYYVLVNYFIVLIGTSAFLFNATNMSTIMQIVLTLLVMASIINLGGIFESRKWVVSLELLRLLITGLVVTLIFYASPYFLPALLFSIIYFFGSSLWFLKYRTLMTMPLLINVAKTSN